MNPLPFLIALLPGLGFVLSMMMSENDVTAAAVVNHVSGIVLLCGMGVYLFNWYMRREKYWALAAFAILLFIPSGMLIAHMLIGMPLTATHANTELMSMLGLLAAVVAALLVYAGGLAATGRKELRARRRALAAKLV